MERQPKTKELKRKIGPAEEKNKESKERMARERKGNYKEKKINYFLQLGKRNKLC